MKPKVNWLITGDDEVEDILDLLFRHLRIEFEGREHDDLPATEGFSRHPDDRGEGFVVVRRVDVYFVTDEKCCGKKGKHLSGINDVRLYFVDEPKEVSSSP